MLSTRKGIAVLLTLSLSALPIVACTNQPKPSGAEGGSSSASAAAAFDVSSWKTLGDGIALATDSPSYGYDGKTLVILIKAGNSYARMVAESEEDLHATFYSLDSTAPDYIAQLTKAIGNLPIKSAEDITSQLLSDEQLASLVGKTGQELVDDGFEFESFFMYGGDQTGAEFGKGCFAYDFTFDTQTSEADADKGELTQAILDAKCSDAQHVSFSNSAFEAK